MTSEEERHHILEMLEAGKITPQQALDLISALEALPTEDEPEEEMPELEAYSESPNQPEPEVIDPGPQMGADSTGSGFNPDDLAPDFRRLRRFWVLPLSAGLVVVFIGALLLFQTYQSGGLGFWFWCSWLPFLLGVAAVWLAARSRKAPWMHLRVEQPEGEWPRRIAFSLPLPVDIARWGVGLAQRFNHDRDELSNLQRVDKMLDGLNTHIPPDAPLVVQVDEGEGKERVFLYIG